MPPSPPGRVTGGLGGEAVLSFPEVSLQFAGLEGSRLGI